MLCSIFPVKYQIYKLQFSANFMQCSCRQTSCLPSYWKSVLFSSLAWGQTIFCKLYNLLDKFKCFIPWKSYLLVLLLIKNQVVYRFDIRIQMRIQPWFFNDLSGKKYFPKKTKILIHFFKNINEGFLSLKKFFSQRQHLDLQNMIFFHSFLKNITSPRSGSRFQITHPDHPNPVPHEIRKRS